MTNPSRVWEIDFCRGIALVFMIIYHLFFDLKEFYGYPVQFQHKIFSLLGQTSAVLFILIAAVSCSFSRDNPRRAVKILIAAGLVTVGSHLYNPNYGIKFGVLHFLGISILLSPLFAKLPKAWLPVLGTGILVFGQYLDRMTVQSNYLFLFNLTNQTWVSGDFYPLFPWLGPFLYGIFLGKLLYPRQVSLFSFTPRGKVLNLIGRHTLAVYLIHQPLLLLIISIFVKVFS